MNPNPPMLLLGNPPNPYTRTGLFHHPKGSPEAKAYMAKLRAMRGKKRNPLTRKEQAKLLHSARTAKAWSRARREVDPESWKYFSGMWSGLREAAQIGKAPRTAEKIFDIQRREVLGVGRRRNQIPFPHLSAMHAAAYAANPKGVRGKGGLHVVYSPVNMAWFLMWQQQVLAIYPTKSEAVAAMKRIEAGEKDWRNNPLPFPHQAALTAAAYGANPTVTGPGWTPDRRWSPSQVWAAAKRAGIPGIPIRERKRIVDGYMETGHLPEEIFQVIKDWPPSPPQEQFARNPKRCPPRCNNPAHGHNPMGDMEYIVDYQTAVWPPTKDLSLWAPSLVEARRRARTELTRRFGRGNYRILQVVPSRNPPRRRYRGAYYHQRIEDPKKFDPRSFRLTGRPTGHRVLIGCPKGGWDPAAGRCRVGTRAQAILHPRTAAEAAKLRRRGVRTYPPVTAPPVRIAANPELPAHVANDPRFRRELAAYRRRHGGGPVEIRTIQVPKGYPKFMSVYGKAPHAVYDAPKHSTKGKRIHHFGEGTGRQPWLVSSAERGPKFLAYVGGTFKAKPSWIHD